MRDSLGVLTISGLFWALLIVGDELMDGFTIGCIVGAFLTSFIFGLVYMREKSLTERSSRKFDMKRYEHQKWIQCSICHDCKDEKIDWVNDRPVHESCLRKYLNQKDQEKVDRSFAKKDD